MCTQKSVNKGGAETNDSSKAVTPKFFINCLYTVAIIPKDNNYLNDGRII